MHKIDMYETLTGTSPDTSSVSLRYKAATVAGRRTFIGNIRVNLPGGEYELHNDRMVVSNINQLDVFPYPNNILDLDINDGDKIVSLMNVGPKVLQFKQRILYVIDISTGIAKDFFVEGRHKFRGILHKNHTCEIEDGIFWFNENGAYIYNGDDIANLFIKGGELTKDNRERIDLSIWNDFISEDSICGYNPKSKEIFIVKNTFHTTPNDGDAYVYNIVADSWVIAKHKFYAGENKYLTNFINLGTDGRLSFLNEGDFNDTNSTIIGPKIQNQAGSPT
jgi:hypothetical protein